MGKRFRPYTLQQPVLIPPCLEDWIPEDHLARFIVEVTGELDLSGIYAHYQRGDGRGAAAFDPLLMTRLLLYGYCTGLTSSRKLEEATWFDVPVRYLCADQHPDHDVIADFRRTHLQALAALFVQVLEICQQEGLVKLGTVAIDGTKVLANASTRRSVPYQKLKEREQYWQQEVQRLFAEAEQADRQAELQGGPSPFRMTKQMAQAQGRLERIRQALAAVEERAQQELAAAQAAAAADPPPRRPGRPRKDEAAQVPSASERALRKSRRRRVKRAGQAAQQPTQQYNFVDPDSRVMRDNARKCYVQSYNAQAAVDAHAQIIVAAEITQEVTDEHQLVPMVRSVRATAGATPRTVVADAGYWGTDALRHPSLTGMEVLVSPDSKPHAPDETPPATNARNEDAQRMRARLSTPHGQCLYALRKQTVEPVFGQIKEARGIRRFRLRGLPLVECEWKLICATHNVLKLFRYRTGRLPRTSGRSPSALLSSKYWPYHLLLRSFRPLPALTSRCAPILPYPASPRQSPSLAA